MISTMCWKDFDESVVPVDVMRRLGRSEYVVLEWLATNEQAGGTPASGYREREAESWRL